MLSEDGAEVRLRRPASRTAPGDSDGRLFGRVHRGAGELRRNPSGDRTLTMIIGRHGKPSDAYDDHPGDCEEAPAMSARLRQLPVPARHRRSPRARRDREEAAPDRRTLHCQAPWECSPSSPGRSFVRQLRRGLSEKDAARRDWSALPRSAWSSR